jgi:membrane fusion protein (multidrug efflux system)
LVLFAFKNRGPLRRRLLRPFPDDPPMTSPSPRRLALLLLIPVLLAGCGKDEPKKPAVAQRPAPEVVAMTIAPQAIPYVSTFVAQTESSRQVDIVARVSGFLDRIAYQEGEVVREGQVLFQLDSKPFEAQLDAARGELQAQQARFTTAQANLNRIKPLAQQNALSQADLDRAQGEFDSSKAAVFSAQAKVKEAELNLGYTTIKSPVTGLASRAVQRQGAYINSMGETAKLTYVAAVDPIWVNFSVSQNQAANWRELYASGELVRPPNNDYVVELIMPDGRRLPQRGRINFADPSFSQDTGSFLVRAVLPNPQRELRPGMFVTAEVHGAMRPNAIIVPQLAVQQGSNGHLVYVVNAQGAAEIRPVVVGDYVGEKDIVITKGLAAGDRVVIDGVLRVVPGQPVRVSAMKTQAEATSVPAVKAEAPPPAAAGATPRTVAAEMQGRGSAAAPAAPIPAGPYGPVRAGETLLGIARRAQPEGVSMEQTLVGIYRANPAAFEPDHHRLKTGVSLTVPPRDALAAIPQPEAVAEVKAASDKWFAGHPRSR